MRALQSEGKIFLIYSYFEIRVYFHPYYDMTLGFKPLGLVLPLFLRKFSFIMYTCTDAYVIIISPWHLTRGLVTVSHRYSTALSFHKTAGWWLSLVAFGMTVLLCFCGASGCSTLFTLGNPYIMEIPRCLHLRGYGHPILWLRCALQTFGIKTLSQAYALVRINPREIGWLSSFFSLWVKKYKWSLWKPFFVAYIIPLGC